MSEPQSATIAICNVDGRSEQCDLKFEVSHENVVMRTESVTLGSQIWNGRDAFHALELFRREIEPEGWRTLCNGARRKAYPSGMCRDMGRGFMLYPIPSNGPPNLRTFEPAPIEEVGTVEEQLTVWNDWREGIKKSAQSPKASLWKRLWKKK
ncbi:MAG: hypothetical protein ABL909_08625 [Sphingopyxis sp.]